MSAFRSNPRAWCAATALALLTAAAVVAQERDRTKIPDQYKWNLAEICPSEAAWRAAKEKLAAELPELRQFQGKLASSPKVLADALDKDYALDKELSRLYAYASMLADQDTRDAQHQGMRQEMIQLASAFAAQAAFIEPELLRAGKTTLERFVAEEPRLKVYRFYLENVMRRAAHTLTDNEEKTLSDGHAQRWPVGQARSGGVQRSADAAEPRRPRQSHDGLLSIARRIRPHP